MNEPKDKPAQEGPGPAPGGDTQGGPPDPGAMAALPGTHPVPGEGVTDEQVRESGLDEEGG